MFTSLIETARKSPFSGPFTQAHCAAAAPGAIGANDSCEFGSTKFFLLCGVGGVISCGKYSPPLHSVLCNIMHYARNWLDCVRDCQHSI